MSSRCSTTQPDDDDQLDQRLQLLVIEAQEQPTDSLRRKKTLATLFKEIHQARTLWRNQTRYWYLENSFYEDLRQEALQQVSLEFFKRIDNYNPQKPVMAWINHTLQQRFKDILHEHFTKGTTPKFQNKVPIISLDQLDTFISERLISGEYQISDEELLNNHLSDDPDKIFGTKHIKGHPQATFQYIAIALLNGKKWKDISTDLGGIPISTLSSFYERSLKDFIPLIQEKLNS